MNIKKVLVGLLALSFCIGLCGCSVDDLIGKRQPETVEFESFGPWQLDPNLNELSSFNDLFPGYAEWGSQMEIKSDGSVFWCIGAESWQGSYVADNDVLHADLISDLDQSVLQQEYVVTYSDEKVNLEMNYKDQKIYWVYGDSSDDAYPVPIAIHVENNSDKKLSSVGISYSANGQLIGNVDAVGAEGKVLKKGESYEYTLSNEYFTSADISSLEVEVFVAVGETSETKSCGKVCIDSPHFGWTYKLILDNGKGDSVTLSSEVIAIDNF